MCSSGLHLFNRQTGQNILLDEFRLPSSYWASAPRHVSIALTNLCDLRCCHCFVSKTPAELDFKQVVSWLHELDNHGSLGVGFGGGEPTMYPRFAELCKYVTQKTSLAVSFTTHGHHLTGELASALDGYVHFIRVSVDGVDDTYEEIRGRSFHMLCKRLRTIKQLAPYGINIIVNSKTILELDKIINIGLEFNASEILLIPEQPHQGHKGIDRSTYSAMRRWVNNYRGEIPLLVSENGACQLPICNPFSKEPSLLAYAHIDAFGMLKRSSFDSYGIAINNGSVINAIKDLMEEW